MTIFNTEQYNHLNQPMFFGEPTGVARYEEVKHKVFETLTDKTHSFFWRPNEVNLQLDKIEYEKLKPHEQQIFINNLKYQTLLDSIQGRAPSVAFTDICSDVSLETWIQTWTFSETIHSRSYTHIMRNLFIDPSKEFDTIVLNENIMKRAHSISEYYDDLINKIFLYKSNKVDLREVKKALYLCMHCVNALEAIRFYVSFACTFNFYENMGVMEGNSKIMKLIARDEQLHNKGTQYIIRQWQAGKDDPEMVEIAKELEDKATEIFIQVANQELEWVDYLFKDGTVPGLNHKILKKYVKYLVNSNMPKVGLKSPYEPVDHPIPWIKSYLNSDNVQVAPQEVEISSYLISQIDNDLNASVLNNLKITYNGANNEKIRK